MRIDLTKAYKTKGGLEVRLFADNGIDGYEIIGAIKTKRGWEPEAWSRSGQQRMFVDDPYDLVEVKPSFNKEIWLNIYADECGLHAALGYEARRDADAGALKSRFACVSVTVNCEEGEGL